MAKTTGLSKGDFVTVRWRDIGGTFDAADIRIVEVMATEMPTIDQGQIWLPIEQLGTMMRAPGEATLVVVDLGATAVPDAAGAGSSGTRNSCSRRSSR